MGFQTDCTTTGEDREQYGGSIPPPIFETSLFTFPTYEAFETAFGSALMGDAERSVYTRGSNPTVQVLERKIALLEEGEEARAFASGMAAILAAILSEAKSGDHVVATRSIYANAWRLLHGYLPQLGIETSFVDFTDSQEVERAVRPNTRVLYLETPANPTMHITDLGAIASLAHDRGLTTIVDSTMATPYNQRPLVHGIDLVVHSATKYISGHSDVVAGLLVGSTARMRSISQLELRDMGAIIGPFEAWLLLRGVRTLGIRMQAHNNAGLRVARWLEDRPEVVRVLYPGLESHPQHDLASRQMSGFSGLLSVVLRGGHERAVRFANHLSLFGIGVSWGGFESLALPYKPDPSVPDEIVRGIGIEPGLVRLSIGLEDVDDLLADLDRALTGEDSG